MSPDLAPAAKTIAHPVPSSAAGPRCFALPHVAANMLGLNVGAAPAWAPVLALLDTCTRTVIAAVRADGEHR